MSFVVPAVSTLTLACVALGQEFPNPNPVPQADGTSLWYVGNNTQYPVIQEVLDAMSDGDEVVVRAGLYVESLHIDKNEITFRPFVSTADISQQGFDAKYESVTFLNPTSGFNNDNGYAMKMTGGRGTYIGEPRQFTELSNGLDVLTAITPRDQNDYSELGSPVPLEMIEASGVGGDSEFSQIARTFEFQSRSLDDFAIWSDSGLGSFSGILVTSKQGSGGGILASGSNNQTMFTGLVMRDLYATGNIHEESGEPVCVLNITGDRTTQARFSNLVVHDNDSSQYGAIYINGSSPSFSFFSIIDNDCRAAHGTVMAKGGSGTFQSPGGFARNQSGRGTFYWDAEGSASSDLFEFNSNTWQGNTTVTNQYGGVAWVEHASQSGEQPQISFSLCSFYGNNGLGFIDPLDPEGSYLETDADYAIHTPYFPEYRIGIPNYGTDNPVPFPVTGPSQTADINNDGEVDADDIDELFSMLGMCRTDLDNSGEIDFNDMLDVLVQFGDTCE